MRWGRILYPCMEARLPKCLQEVMERKAEVMDRKVITGSLSELGGFLGTWRTVPGRDGERQQHIVVISK